MKKKIHVKTGDTVYVISGKDKGKKGKVLQVSPEEGKIIVEGISLVKKHVKPRKMGDPGGIIKAEAPLYASKVMPICPNCNKPTRVGHLIADDGTKYRVCKQKDCGETF